MEKEERRGIEEYEERGEEVDRVIEKYGERGEGADREIWRKRRGGG